MQYTHTYNALPVCHLSTSFLSQNRINISQTEHFIQRLKVKVHMQTQETIFVSIHVFVFGESKKKTIFVFWFGRRSSVALTHREMPRIPNVCNISTSASTVTHKMRLTGVSPKKQYSSKLISQRSAINRSICIGFDSNITQTA